MTDSTILTIIMVLVGLQVLISAAQFWQNLPPSERPRRDEYLRDRS